MKIKSKYVLVISAILLAASMTVHALIFKGVTNMPSFVDLGLTVGMVLAWLFTSKLLKILNQTEPDLHPVKTITQNTPAWLVFITAFFLFYAVINMGMMIRTGWKGSELRGISGFWLFFYSLSILVSVAHIRQRRLHSDKVQKGEIHS